MAKRTLVIEDLARLRTAGRTVFDPRDNSVVTAVKECHRNKYVTQLHRINLDSGEATQITFAEEGASSPSFRPRTGELSFVRTAGEKPAQIYVQASGAEARAVTELPEGKLMDYKWSPDGRYLAMLFLPTAEERTKAATEARKKENGSDVPWIADELWYRLDGFGYFGNDRPAIYLHDTDTGKMTRLFDKCSLGMMSFDWMPKSDGIAVTYNPYGEPFNQPPEDAIALVDLKGKVTRLKDQPRGRKGNVAVSPDGKSIAYLGSEHLDSSWGIYNTRIFVYDLTKEKATCLTADNDYDFGVMTGSDCQELSTGDFLRWSPDGKSVITSLGTFGTGQIARTRVKKPTTEVLTEGQFVFAPSDVHPETGAVVGTVTDWTRPVEVALWKEGQSAPERKSDFNSELLKELDLATCESLEIPTTDDLKLHLWLVRPPKSAGSAKKRPAIIEVHGGPHTQYGCGFFHEFQLLAAQGYLVAFSNPRGSKGYGEEWTRAIHRDWGNKDWDDVLALTEWLKSHAEVDNARIGIMGGSYGGYMTNWAVGHSQDYKAAITDRCVSNLVSIAGTSDFPLNRGAYFGGYAYGDLEKIRELWRQSPLAYFDQVNTPMLIIHSEGDLRCSIEQGEQVFTALKLQGVEARLVRYPRSSSHGLSRSGPMDLRFHRLNQIVKWWGRHMAEAPASKSKAKVKKPKKKA